VSPGKKEKASLKKCLKPAVQKKYEKGISLHKKEESIHGGRSLQQKGERPSGDGAVPEKKRVQRERITGKKDREKIKWRRLIRYEREQHRIRKERGSFRRDSLTLPENEPHLKGGFFHHGKIPTSLPKRRARDDQGGGRTSPLCE